MENSNKKINIAFAHNVYNRKKTLIETINIEKNIFPESQISVAYNFVQDLSDLKNLGNITLTYFNQKEHKIGCANGFIISIQALKEVPDIIFFSHDDVRIKNGFEDIFMENCNKIISGEYDVICRKPMYLYGKNYYMMEGIFLNGKKIYDILKKFPIFIDEKFIPKDIRNKNSPEVFIYNLITSNKLKVKVIEYDNLNENEYNKYLNNTMGIEHLNYGKRGWNE